MVDLATPVDLEGAYNANLKDLFFFFKHYGLYVFIPSLFFWWYYTMAWTFFICRDFFRIDIVGWMDLYVRRGAVGN